MPPTWLTNLAWIHLCVCFVCAGVIGYDIVFGGRRQPMGVMNVVFPITALYFGPAAVALYWRWERVGPPPARIPSSNTGAKMAPMAMGAARQGMHEGPHHGIDPNGHTGPRIQSCRPGLTGPPWRSRSATVARDAPSAT